jgi:hypothetical protein
MGSGLIGEITGQELPEVERGVAGARIALFHSLKQDDSPDRDSVWQAATEADERGFFELSSYAAPGERNLVGLEVSAPGFETVYRAFWDLHDVEPQVFVVLLERKEQDRSSGSA